MFDVIELIVYLELTLIENISLDACGKSIDFLIEQADYLTGTIVIGLL